MENKSQVSCKQLTLGKSATAAWYLLRRLCRRLHTDKVIV